MKDQYEVGPKRNLMGPLMRMLFVRADIQKVKANHATSAAGSGSGKILFIPSGSDASHSKSLIPGDAASSDINFVLYPLHAHPIGTFGA